MKNLIITFLVSIAFLHTNAQSKLHFFIGPGLGQVQGDLTETGLPHPSSLKFNGKLGVGYDFNDKWGLRLHGSGGKMHGSDDYTMDKGKQARGGTFNTLLIDAGLTLKYQNIFKSSKYINYGFAGLDYMYMAPSVSFSGDLPLPQENSFSNHQINIPVGIGLGYWITDYIGVVYEGSIHFTFTDYLDGVSMAGNPNATDNYIDSHLMLLFRFGGKKGKSRGKFKSRGRLNSFAGFECPKF